MILLLYLPLQTFIRNLPYQLANRVHLNYIVYSYLKLLQIVITLEIYGVKNIVGIPFGYRGFGKELAEMPVSSFFL